MPAKMWAYQPSESRKLQEAIAIQVRYCNDVEVLEKIKELLKNYNKWETR